MSEEEVSEERINERLEEIMEECPDPVIRLFAKLIFNLRYDLHELAEKILSIFKNMKEGIDVDVDVYFDESEGVIRTIDDIKKTVIEDLYI